MVAVLEKRNIRDFDWLTAILAISIVCFGVWQIYNAQPTETYWSKQITGLFIALVALVVIAATDYRRVIDYAPIFYVLGLVLLLLVLTPLGVKVC
jgi:rod shape determining protein RodA